MLWQLATFIKVGGDLPHYFFIISSEVASG